MEETIDKLVAEKEELEEATQIWQVKAISIEELQENMRKCTDRIPGENVTL